MYEENIQLRTKIYSIFESFWKIGIIQDVPNYQRKALLIPNIHILEKSYVIDQNLFQSYLTYLYFEEMTEKIILSTGGWKRFFPPKFLVSFIDDK